LTEFAGKIALPMSTPFEDIACALPTMSLESQLIERNRQEEASVAVRGESQWSMI
jgi:hypothetical protein